MSTPSDYRKRADECFEIAQTAQTSAQRTMLVHIAETWLRLASDAEAKTSTNGAYSSANGAHSTM